MLEVDDGSVTVPFTEFQSHVRLDERGQVMKNKDGKEMKKLTPVSHQVTLEYLLQFLQNLLPNLIHHRNLLRLFRNTKRMFMDLFECVYLDVDFSENLTIDIKYEPQSRYWSKTTVTDCIWV